MRQTILDLSDAREIFDSIIKHWQNSNQSLRGSGIVLKGNYTVDSFVAAVAQFDEMSANIDSVVEQRDKASEQLWLFKTNMRLTMQRFAFLVRGLQPEYAKDLPALPDVRSHEAKFMASVEKTQQVWKRISRIQPIVMPDGTTFEAFSQGIQVLRVSFKARERAFAQERHLRAQRRQHHQALINRAVQYRSLVLGTFGEENVLSKTLPYLWPKQDRTKKPKSREQKLEVIDTETMLRVI
ncbi:MAG: hypothetical protein JST12_09490 [Armatimonadetes bacterium]|nr:hypothetical protein [Armatimonadota bacterium]MBS1701881.1 hypothetical protein [Armatimonadota bacterium]MBS1728281.1 hypothetical protein [Armatimonadota bacterium]